MTHEFVEAIETYFAPFLNGLGFELSSPISISGKHYCATFLRSDRAVVVSYEPGDDYLFIALPTVVNGIQSDLDNRDSADNLHHRVRSFSESALFVWFSSHSELNGVASLMAYSVKDEDEGAWYASFRKEPAWQVAATKGIPRERLLQLFPLS